MMKNNFPNNDFKLKHEIESKLRTLTQYGTNIIKASEVMNFTAEYVAEGRGHINACNTLYQRFEKGEYTPELLADINVAGERMASFMDSLDAAARAAQEDARKAASATHNTVSTGMAETLKKMRAMKGIAVENDVAASKKPAIVFEDRSMGNVLGVFDPAHMN